MEGEIMNRGTSGTGWGKPDIQGTLFTRTNKRDE